MTDQAAGVVPSADAAVPRGHEDARVDVSSRARVAAADRVALLLLMLAGVAVRLYHVASLPGDKHYFRQTQTLGTVVTFWRDGIDLLRPVIISFGKPGILVLEFPLYQAIAAVLYKVVAPNVMYARMVSIAASLAMAYFVYKIARLFYDRREPLYAAAFALFTPLGIYYGRATMLDVFQVALGTAFFYYAAAYILERRWYRLALAMLVGSCAFVVKPPYALPLLVPLLYLYFKTYGIRIKPGAIAALVVPVALMFAWQRYANAANTHYNAGKFPYEQLKQSIQVKIWPPNEWYFGTIAQRLDPGYYVRLAGRVGIGILAGVGAIPFVAGVFARIEKRDYVCLAWLASVLGSFLLFFNLNIVHDYYQMPLLPIAAIFCGKGLQVLVERVEQRRDVRAGRIGLVAFALVYVVALAAVVIGVGYYDQIGASRIAMGQEIGRDVPGDDMVAVSTRTWGDFDPSVLYFAGKRGYMVPQWQLDPEKLDYLLESGVSVLVVSEGQADVPAETKARLRDFPARQSGELTFYDLGGEDAGAGVQDGDDDQ